MSEYVNYMEMYGFVSIADAVPDVILDLRYYSTYNFVGERIRGYEEPIALLTKEAASALRLTSKDFAKRGYKIKLYDAYRPKRAVEHFLEWAKNDDEKMKSIFYPEIKKEDIIKLGYVASESSHSRGSTVDITLADAETEQDIDMGSTFDFFSEISYSDYEGNLTEEQKRNRSMLREEMQIRGWEPLKEEWWHFTLKYEPYPNIYFDFPIKKQAE